MTKIFHIAAPLGVEDGCECVVLPDRKTRQRIGELRRRVTELRDVALRGERIPIQGVNNPLPWRLTTAAKVVVNRRVVEICYPHYTPVCSLDKKMSVSLTMLDVGERLRN